MLVFICISIFFTYIPEVESSASGGTHTASPANPKASNASWGKDGPGLIKMEGVHVLIFHELM